MKQLWLAAGALLAALVTIGCEQSHTQRGSSGSNWLSCEEFADCSAAAEARSCSAAGFCLDAEGDRIPYRPQDDAGASDAGMTMMIMPAPPNEGAPADACAWGVDQLLEQVGKRARDRASCGLYNIGSRDHVVAAMGCFEDLTDDPRGVEVTINRCIDCIISTTYVATGGGGELFAVGMAEAPVNSGDRRTASVERCSAVVLDPATQDVVCEDAVQLYECSDSYAGTSPTLPPRPLVPLKLSDAPPRTGVPTVPLHVYVSNQSFQNALVNIELSLDDRLVVMGDFDVGSQHNWYDFDLQVPAGRHRLHAISVDGDASISQTIEVPEERWLVLDYWFYADEPEGGHFTLSLHTQQVGFE